MSKKIYNYPYSGLKGGKGKGEKEETKKLKSQGKSLLKAKPENLSHKVYITTFWIITQIINIKVVPFWYRWLGKLEK